MSTEEGEQFAAANGLEYLEASAKSGFNVEKCFMSPAGKIMANIKQGVYDFADTVGCM